MISFVFQKRQFQCHYQLVPLTHAVKMLINSACKFCGCNYGIPWFKFILSGWLKWTKQLFGWHNQSRLTTNSEMVGEREWAKFQNSPHQIWTGLTEILAQTTCNYSQTRVLSFFLLNNFAIKFRGILNGSNKEPNYVCASGDLMVMILVPIRVGHVPGN